MIKFLQLTLGVLLVLNFNLALAQDSDLDAELTGLEESLEGEFDDLGAEGAEMLSEEDIEAELDQELGLEEELTLDEQPIAEEAPQESPAVIEEQQPVAEETLQAEQEALPMDAPAVEVTNIKFLANQSGGTVVIETSAEAMVSARSNPETNQYVIEIQNASLPEKLKRPYILKEFKGASFAQINAYQTPGSAVARVVVQLNEAGPEPLIQQEGSSILVIPAGQAAAVAEADEMQPPEPVQMSVPADGGTPEVSYNYQAASETEKLILNARTLEEFLLSNNKFYGKPISIQVNDASIRDVINFISEESGTNIVVSDDVSGKISVKLRKIPWDQALVIIMRSKDLGYVRQGNVLRIATIGKLEAERKAAQTIIDDKKKYTPLKVQVLPISYAEVSEISKKVEPFLSKTRGKTVADERTSSLIVTDTAENIAKIKALIKELDVPPRQVLIEGKIVEAIENIREEFGFNWSASGDEIELGETSDGGAITALPNLNISQTAGTSGILNFNLNIGTLDIFGDIDARLNLLETNDKIKVISSPRVVTMNNEEANIDQTIARPYTTVVITTGSTVPATVVNFQEFTLNMKVKPQITSDASVIMDIDVTRSIPAAAAESSGSTSSNSSSAKTKVLVKNGQTAIVGGIYQGNTQDSKSQVPYLGDIPVLGWLFKSKSNNKQKSELVVFLTPRIIDSQQLLGQGTASEEIAPVQEATDDLSEDFENEVL